MIDRYGTAGGPLVIAVHGAAANRKTWLPLVRVLSPDLEAWCLDLPGHGARANEPFVLARALDAIDAAIDAAAPRRAIVAGDSLGGYLALLAAARNAGTDRLAGVCAGGCTWTMTGIDGVLSRATDLPVRLLERIAGTARLERYARRILRSVTDLETAAAIEDAGLRLRARSESLTELRGFDLVATVRAIDVPLAIVNGARDWPTRAGESAVLRNARRATLTIAAGTGHGVGFLAPSVFARAIERLARASYDVT